MYTHTTIRGGQSTGSQPQRKACTHYKDVEKHSVYKDVYKDVYTDVYKDVSTQLKSKSTTKLTQ